MSRKKTGNEKPLNHRQRDFVRLYLTGPDGVRGKLRDWRELAADAQETLTSLQRGLAPIDGKLMTMADPGVVPGARVMLAAATEILDRAYPKRLHVAIEDPQQTLATLLGVPVSELPEAGGNGASHVEARQGTDLAGTLSREGNR